MIKFYENFELALGKLTSFLEQYDGSQVHQAGVIQAFEFTFEQCWHCLQRKAGREGLPIASPKKAFEYAFKAGLIPPSDEQLWLTMIEDRNKTTHVYRETLAELVFKKIQAAYQPAFEKILKKLKS